MSIRPPLIGGELSERTTTLTSPVQRPGHHRPPDPPPPKIGTNPNGLDGHPLSPTATQRRSKGQLTSTDDRTAPVLRHDQLIPRIGGDLVEGRPHGCVRGLGDDGPGSGDLVVDQQFEDCRDVVAPGDAEDQLGHVAIVTRPSG